MKMSEVAVPNRENVEEANTFITEFHSLASCPDACGLMLSASLKFSL